jgi:hypothetical protein
LFIGLATDLYSFASWSNECCCQCGFTGKEGRPETGTSIVVGFEFDDYEGGFAKDEGGSCDGLYD